MPQPDQVILPQVEHRAGLHMGVSSERHRDSSEPYPWGYRDVTPARHPSRRGGPPGWVPAGGSGGRATQGGEDLAEASRGVVGHLGECRVAGDADHHLRVERLHQGASVVQRPHHHVAGQQQPDGLLDLQRSVRQRRVARAEDHLVRQVDVQLGLERPGHVDRRQDAEALARQRLTGCGDGLGERAVEDRGAAVVHQGLLGGVPTGHDRPAQWACECSAWSWSWPAWSWSASCSAICRRTSSMSSARTWPIRSSSAEPGRAPGWEKTRIPWRKIIRVGMDVMPDCDASACSASVSTLPNTMSWLASDAFSKTGANIRHGPHQAAQKSTNTMSLSAMVDSKVVSVRLTVDMLLLGGRGLSGHQYRIPLGVSTPDHVQYSRGARGAPLLRQAAPPVSAVAADDVTRATDGVGGVSHRPQRPQP